MKDPFCKGEIIDNPVFEKTVNRARSNAFMVELYGMKTPKSEELPLQREAALEAAKAARKARAAELREKRIRGR